MSRELEAKIRQLSEAFQGWQDREVSVFDALGELLEITDSRAVGLWRLEGNSLQLVGFQAKSDMPADVKRGFAEATRTVSLNQTGLGIVKAAVDRRPAVAHREAGETGLSDSAGWLARFEAVQSLAVPIGEGERMTGVLAMSTANRFVEDDETWQLLTGIAARLGNDNRF